ncbi:hypothetical protein [Methanofollis tationis]|uniref:Uncharacterized protein n=1 Tax=Methanofollis tationis TaxID=81417 RepID=A0A7K4HR24_9EURY|nr:hypothetical protein [Methanofollis tationis]NVO67622.1 hypothetical protein [Methanofollis tationis]
MSPTPPSRSSVFQRISEDQIQQIEDEQHGDKLYPERNREALFLFLMDLFLRRWEFILRLDDKRSGVSALLAAVAKAPIAPEFLVKIRTPARRTPEHDRDRILSAITFAERDFAVPPSTPNNLTANPP